MSRLIFDKKECGPVLYSDTSEWTTERLKDEFFLCLVKVTGDKYYEQAKNLIFRIPLTQQYPRTEEESVPFILDFEDLSSRVQSEFEQYCTLYSKKRIGLLLKEIVIRLFENLDFEYAHMSVMRKLRIRIRRYERNL